MHCASALLTNFNQINKNAPREFVRVLGTVRAKCCVSNLTRFLKLNASTAALIRQKKKVGQFVLANNLCVCVCERHNLNKLGNVGENRDGSY